MKKIILPLVILLLFSQLVSATTYYVSNTGNDTNTGASPSAPWKTIAKVNSMMSGLAPGDSVLFKRGDVFKERLTITRSGTAVLPIVFSSYGAGPKALLDGKDTLSGWTLYGGNIWRAYYNTPGGYVCNNVFKNGKPLRIGRWPNPTAPNNGFRSITGVSGSTSISDNTLSGTPNWTNAKVVIRFNHWSLVSSTITSHSGSTIAYQNSSAYTPQVNWGYYIQDHLSTLDMDGEWYCDTLNKYVYLYTTENPTSSLIEIAVRQNLISFGTSVSHIIINDIDCTGSAANAIEGNGNTFVFMRNIQFKNCGIYYPGQSGISLYRANQVQVDNCYIYGSNFHGISLFATDSSIIERSIIKASALTPGMAPEQNGSVRIGGGANAVTIRNNYFDSTGYGHIIWSGANHLFKNNLMLNYCMRTDDGGAVYCFHNTQLNNRIEGNIFSDGQRAPDGIPASQQNAPAAAIYADEGSANITISHNTIARSFTGVNFNNAASITVHNNTLFANNTHLRFTRWTTNDPAGPMRGYSVKNNIVFGFGQNDTLLRAADASQFEITSFGAIDSNYYCAQNGQAKQVFTTETTGNQNRLQHITEWTQRYGHDDSSTYVSYSLPFEETLENNVWFQYNATNAGQSFALPAGTFRDATGNTYTGSANIAAYGSLALYKVKPDSVFAQDNIIVLRLDSLPAAATAGTANKAFIEEFDATGALVKSIDLSTYNFYVAAKDMAEGILNRSADGAYLALSGYTAKTGITGSTSRAIALIKHDGTINITTVNPSVMGNVAPRGVATVDGTDIWLVGNGASGVIHTTAGSSGAGTAIAGTTAGNNTIVIPGAFTSATVFSTTTVNVSANIGLAAGHAVSGPGIPPGTTVVSNTNNTITLSAPTTDLSQTNITITRSNNSFENLCVYDNQLYYSANTGFRIGKVGNGLPVSLPDNTLKGELFGPGANPPSPTPEQVFMAKVNGQDVLYISTQTGGIYKYQKVSGIWTLKGSYTVPNVSFTGNTSTGNNTITGAGTVTGLCPGMFVTGSGISAGTYITGISGTSITLSTNATSTGSAVSLTGRNTFYNVTGIVKDSLVTLYAVKNAPLSIATGNTVTAYSQVLKIEDQAGPSGSLSLAVATTIVSAPPSGDSYKSAGLFAPVTTAFMHSSATGPLKDQPAGIARNNPGKEGISLKIYPNPVDQQAYLYHGKLQGRAYIKVYTVTGALLFSRVINTDAAFTEIDTSMLRRGYYVIEFVKGTQKTGIAFIKR